MERKTSWRNTRRSALHKGQLGTEEIGCMCQNAFLVSRGATTGAILLTQRLFQFVAKIEKEFIESAQVVVLQVVSRKSLDDNNLSSVRRRNPAYMARPPFFNNLPTA